MVHNAQSETGASRNHARRLNVNKAVLDQGTEDMGHVSVGNSMNKTKSTILGLCCASESLLHRASTVTNVPWHLC